MAGDMGMSFQVPWVMCFWVMETSCRGGQGGSRAVGFVICAPSPWDLQRVMENSERSSDTSLTGTGSSSNSLNSLLRLGHPSIFP